MKVICRREPQQGARINALQNTHVDDDPPMEKTYSPRRLLGIRKAQQEDKGRGTVSMM
jgi:hypothetical protein